jgi:hypothetical protein
MMAARPSAFCECWLICQIIGQPRHESKNASDFIGRASLYPSNAAVAKHKAPAIVRF